MFILVTAVRNIKQLWQQYKGNPFSRFHGSTRRPYVVRSCM